jgi:membrane fusion protein, adhesin transport system
MTFFFKTVKSLKNKIKGLIRGVENDDAGAETPGLYHSRIGQPHKASYVLVNSIVGLIVVMVIWAALAHVDEVTHAEGRMIPSAKMQVLQNMEGGIVEKIEVRQGDLVEKGQVLVTLSSTQFVADFETKKQQVLSLMAKEARLMAELQDKPLVFAPDFLEIAKNYANLELAEYQNRKLRFRADQVVYENQLKNASSELEIVRRLVERGLEPRLEMIRTESRVDEARSKLDALKRQYKSEVSAEMAKTSLELNPLKKGLPALADRVERTYIKAPMKGVVNRVLVSTVGGVIKPGEQVLEVVPTDDVLVVEAQIRPQDIGFVKIGQMADVKISAYDYSIFGSMVGVVTNLSADAISREERGQTVYYYLARIETKTSVMNSLGKKLPIIPGMQAQVDIITGNKTVMQYLMKPIVGVKENAFRER